MVRPAGVALISACALLATAAPAAALTGGAAPGGSTPTTTGSPGGSAGTVTGGAIPGGGRWRAPTAPRSGSRQRGSRGRPAPQPQGDATALRDVPRLYRRLSHAAARRYGVDWRLLAAIGKNESGHGRSTAAGITSGLNYADCCSGPMQICRVSACGDVWRAYGVDANRDGRASIYDPADSIHAAAAIVADLQRLLGRNPRLLLAAYNAGPGTVQRYRGVPPYRETRSYVASALRYMRRLGPPPR